MDKESREFLLEEYKAAWEMVRYLSQQRDKWMKYYFTIVAAGFSYTGLTLKLSYDKALKKDPCLYKESLINILHQTFQSNRLISISIIFLLILLLIIGALTFLATIYWRKQSTEYYNALNTFRNFIKTKKLDISNYIVLRTDKKEAYAKEGVDFYTSIMIGIINSIISFLILASIFFILSLTLWALLLILAAVAFVLLGVYLHFYFYKKILTK